MVIVKCWMSPHDVEQSPDLLVPLTSTVLDVKRLCSNQSERSVGDLEVFFCGRRLSDNSVLSSCDGLGDQSTVHVLCRKCRELEKPQAAATNSDPAIDALVTSFQTALMDAQHRILLFSIISNSEGLSSLISATPGLKQDTVAQGILKDPYLLMQWLTSENAKELIEKHPCLVEAGQQIMSSLHQEAAGSGTSGLTLFEQQSEDEDYSDDEAENTDRNRFVTEPDADTITAGQLAAALAAAATTERNTQQAAGTARPAVTQRNMPNRPQAGSEDVITTDMFQRALLQAFGRNQNFTETDFSVEIQKLNEMGFTNDEENRRALLATGGNVDNALEYIINERERMEGGMELD